MNIAWFQKILFSQPAWLPDGRRAKFEPVGDDEGVVAISSEETAALYRSLAQKQIGGVIEIDQATYEELKKKPVVAQRKPPEFAPQVHPLSRILQPPPGAAPVAPVAAGSPTPPAPTPPPPTAPKEVVPPKVSKPPPRKKSS